MTTLSRGRHRGTQESVGVVSSLNRRVRVLRTPCRPGWLRRDAIRCADTTPGGFEGGFKGKTMFISGGSRGIGLAIAKRVAADGANVDHIDDERQTLAAAEKGRESAKLTTGYSSKPSRITSTDSARTVSISRFGLRICLAAPTPSTSSANTSTMCCRPNSPVTWQRPNVEREQPVESRWWSTSTKSTVRFATGMPA